MGLRRYVGVIRKLTGSDFGVDFPDVPGCVTAGKNMQEARRRAAEALTLHLEEMAADGRPLPVARDLTTVRDDPAYAGGTTLILVEVPESTARADQGRGARNPRLRPE